MSTAVADPVATPTGTPAAAAAPTGQVVAPAVETKAASAVVAAPTRLLAEDSKPAEVVAAAPEAKAPEWALKAPDGSTWNEAEIATAKDVEAFAKENGLSQAQAEKVLARDGAARTAAATAQKAEAESVAAQWMEQAKAHPEIGGDKLDAAVANAKRALAVYATPEERQAIANSPFANNPMFLAIMSRAAKGLPVEDVAHTNGKGSVPFESMNRPASIYGNVKY